MSKNKKLDTTRDFATSTGHPLVCFEQDGCCFDADGIEVTSDRIKETETVVEQTRKADVSVELNLKNEHIGKLTDQLSITQSDLQGKELALAESQERITALEKEVAALNEQIEEEYQRAEDKNNVISDLQTKITAAETKLAEALAMVNDTAFGVGAPPEGPQGAAAPVETGGLQGEPEGAKNAAIGAQAGSETKIDQTVKGKK